MAKAAEPITLGAIVSDSNRRKVTGKVSIKAELGRLRQMEPSNRN